MPLLGLPIFITAVGLPLQWHSGFCVIAVGQAAKRKQFLGNTFAGILQQRQQIFACALPKHVTSCVMLLVGGRCSLHSRVAISIRLVGACLGWVVGVQMLNGTMYLHTLIAPPIRKFFGFDGNNGFSFFAFAAWPPDGPAQRWPASLLESAAAPPHPCSRRWPAGAPPPP